MRIIFMGTPEFAVASLRKIVEAQFEVVAVITAPDNPSGRGLEIQQSPVKKWALERRIPLMQPEKLQDVSFIEQLKNLRADIQVVVAFRMLPEIIWNMPPKGTINLHASLLPQYRGAAPINWAIINGEKETGVTTFFITHQIDTGNIIDQQKTVIDPLENAASLHNKLMVTGAELLCKTLISIQAGNLHSIPQMEIKTNNLFKPAPKIFKQDCKIDWNKDIYGIHNFIRGLSPYPGAWSEMTHQRGTKKIVKILEALPVEHLHSMPAGKIYTDGKKFLSVAAPKGYVSIQSIQAEGKKLLRIDEFLRGFEHADQYSFTSIT